MSIEIEAFEISHIEWRYQESREITSDRNPRKPIPVGVDSMSVRCKGCGVKWTAARGHYNGHLTVVVGFVRITCPGCGTKSEIPNRLLNLL